MINKFENILENGFEGLFKKAFPKSLSPNDLAKALYKQMLKQRLRSIKHIYVPNYYLIRLHPKDYHGFVSYKNSLIEELIEYLTKRVEERQFYLMGDLEIHLDHDVHIIQGHVEVFSKLQEPLEANGQSQKNGNLDAMNLTDGQTLIYDLKRDGDTLQKWTLKVLEGVDENKIFILTEGRNLIGRQRDAEVCLLDPAVSRYHAQLELYPNQILLSDLGSTNGTFYNGEAIETTLLQPDEEFYVGNTLLVLMEEKDVQ